MKLVLSLLLLTFAASVHAALAPADQAMDCQGDNLKFSFAEHQGTFSMTSPDSDVQVLFCGYLKISNKNTTALHCAANLNNVRYDIYPTVMTDDTISGASVIAWTNDGTATELASMTCTNTK
jgi:hypothetical protein